MPLYKVLVVDDEPFVRRGIVSQTDWASLGFEVVGEAGDGVCGLELARKLQPDLIICDIRMPKMNGIDMLKELRREGNAVSVIFLTAYDEFEYAREALKLYADDYILKPFEDGELEKVILRVKERIAWRRSREGGAEARTAIPEEKNEAKSRYIQEALRYIEAHYMESEISIRDVSGAVGLSEGHLSRMFKKETGITVMNCITRYRMSRALELLSDCRNKVYEVAEQVGYRDIAYFSNTFKKLVGMTPSEYQSGKR